MKTHSHQLISPAAIRQLGLAFSLAVSLNAPAQGILLTEGHSDVGIVYEADQWNLHIGRHDDIPPMEYAPNEAILQVGPAGRATVPANPLYGFLGPAGSSVYILPQADNPALLFLGLGTEEQAGGVFVNDRLTLSLTDVSGPGNFAMYEVGTFGSPTVLMNSGDGITGADKVDLLAGGHRHVNWAFTSLGDYEVTFRASGILDNGLNTFTQSTPATYSFSVAPEPGTFALFGLGGLVLLAARNRKPVQR